MLFIITFRILCDIGSLHEKQISILFFSWEIAEYPGILAPVHPELKALLDEEIGPLSRQLVYAFFLKDSNRPHWDLLCTHRRHWLWRFLWWIGVGNTITGRLEKVHMYTHEKKRFLSTRSFVNVYMYWSYVCMKVRQKWLCRTLLQAKYLVKLIDQHRYYPSYIK